MAAYVIFDVNVQKAAGYEEYRQAGSPSGLPVWCKYFAPGGMVEVVEGDCRLNRAIVIEFKSLDQAKHFYSSPEYQAALPGRLRTAISNVFVVEGI